ncbi:MAG: hypothetical protein JOZ10_17615 [Acidobacteria bacterium]|nr:hypothetical protein [Acidobacteriota bacterium]
MIFTALAGLMLVAGILVVIRLLAGTMEHPSNLMELLDCLEPVNIASFRHLACDADDHYLKANLSRTEYRRLRRLRLSALQGYYYCAFRNSALLLSYGTLLATNQHPGFAQFGHEIRSAAIRLRLALLRGVVGAWICYITPLDIPYWRQITDCYDQVGLQLSLFCGSNFPELELALAEHFWV